ncbi:hypothetical protein [Spongiivirga citrea]|uniref:Uncharacterized protein n=1 Tax=Spongiivirga citrea TaxID=1481457 RepID=A0A6M0CQ19_9FLAO|nr:hypothetical protein [Spongiivirga citrea]NER16030.1 hypothetical protein [Spongiivirga citrea]
MNNLIINQFKICIAFLLIGSVVIAQETKTYKEGFDVSKDVTLNVNTTHTDVQFETWDKDRVEIVATITVEDMDKEDADRYIKNWNFDAKGNSREIDINSGRGSGLFASTIARSGRTDHDYSFRVLPDFHGQFDVEPLLGIIDEMPPMPFVYSGKNKFSFDYEKYKKDGDKYVEKWKKEYKDKYDEDWEERMEKWAKRLAERTEQLEERKSKYAERREKLLKEREEKIKKRQKELNSRVDKGKRYEQERRANGSVIWSDGGQNSFFRVYGGKDDENSAKVKRPSL